MWKFLRGMTCRSSSSGAQCETSRNCSSVTDSPPIPGIYFDELKEEIKKKAYIIDVREVNETNETGTLPGSVNIPLGEIESALQLPPEEFQQKYEHPKPQPDGTLIFSCRSGVRSLTAAKIALQLGFSRVVNYEGGFSDWQSRIVEDKKQ